MPVPADASVSKFIYAMYALKSGQDALRFRPYSVLTATLNVLPLTVRSSNVAAPWTPPISAALVAGSVTVAHRADRNDAAERR